MPAGQRIVSGNRGPLFRQEPLVDRGVSRLVRCFENPKIGTAARESCLRSVEFTAQDGD